jgi:Caspase domain
MTAEVGVPSDARAVLIGVSDYDHPGFPPIRAARNSVQAMSALLADPALCGWSPGQVTVIENPASAADLADQVADLAERTTGVLLLYYVGHGVLSARGELCLTVTATRPSRPQFSGLAWENVAYILRGCPARVRLVILDCCFAGQAIEALSADGEPGLADIAHVSGVYTLTATTPNRTAHVVPPGQQDTACTSFTGELQGLIQSGIPGRPARLTFADIYPVLRQRLRDRGLPAPNQRGTDTAYLFPFTANVADQVQAHAGPSTANAAALADHHGNGSDETPQAVQPSVSADRPEVIRLLDDATRAALAVPGDVNKAEALAHVASAVAAFDPDRAAQLINRAEHILQPTADEADEWDRDVALAWITTALVTIDPGRAEQLAQSITMDYYREVALTEVAVAVAAADPDRAERIAPGEDAWRDEALAAVAIAVAVNDPDRAERIARSITFGLWTAEALGAIAEAVRVSDPDRSRGLAVEAEGIAGPFISENGEAQARFAKVLAATDPYKARDFANCVRYAPLGAAEALAEVAKVLAATDPDEAEHVARSIFNHHWKNTALTEVAKVLAATDPGRAERLAYAVTNEEWLPQALAGIAVVLAGYHPPGLKVSLTKVW